MRCSFRTHPFSRMRFPGRCPGLVCVAHSGPLTDEVGSVLDRAVYFPLAGYAGPGFQNWPGSADVLVGEYETGDSHPKKRRSAPRPGSATHGYKRSGSETTAQVSLLPDEGHWHDVISIPYPRPNRGIAFQRIRAAPLELIPNHVSDSMPSGGTRLKAKASERTHPTDQEAISRLIDQWLLWPVFLSF